MYWLLGTLGLVFVLTILLFGVDGFKMDSTLDINIHDTYFVIANFHCIVILFVATFFWVYFFRSIRMKFKNPVANLVFLISIVLAVLLNSEIISFLKAIHYPRNDFDNSANEIGRNEVAVIMAIFAKVLFGIQIVLLTLLTYVGFKTGRNYKLKR